MPPPSRAESLQRALLLQGWRPSGNLPLGSPPSNILCFITWLKGSVSAGQADLEPLLKCGWGENQRTTARGRRGAAAPGSPCPACAAGPRRACAPAQIVGTCQPSLSGCIQHVAEVAPGHKACQAHPCATRKRLMGRRARHKHNNLYVYGNRGVEGQPLTQMGTLWYVREGQHRSEVHLTRAITAEEATIRIRSNSGFCSRHCKRHAHNSVNHLNLVY